MNFNTPPIDFFSFIASNMNQDTKTLMLREYGKNHPFDLDFAMTQIEARRKGCHKLKSFIGNPKRIFPTSLAYEQASHESVAKYHASLVAKGCNVLDMTAGLGIDSMAFASKGCHVTSCELDEFKAEVLRYNASVSGIETLSVINADSTEWIRQSEGRFDIIFVDPARRSEDDRRLYNFHDCSPDILKNMNGLLDKCDTLLIKASPFLDISQTLKDIPNTRKITTLSVSGECKEVLVEAASGATSVEEAIAIDLTQDGEIKYRFSYRPIEIGTGLDKDEAIIFANERDIRSGVYLYEPGAAVMKLNAWNPLSSQFPGIKKLGTSSHLFVSPVLYKDFPGRILAVDSLIDKRSRKSLKGSPANVVTRNYPIKTEELRKKLGVREGTDRFIYATRLGDSPILISATRIRT